jgi:hypothetical protein
MDPVPVKMRPVDRERLPIGGVIIAVSPIAMNVAPMLAWSGLRRGGR